MGKRIFIIILLIFSLLSCHKKVKVEKNIITSTNVIKSIVHYIAGNRYPVSSLLHTGENPHTKVLKPKDMENAQNGIILFTIGLQLDDWALNVKNLNPKIHLSILGKGLHTKNPHIWFSPEYSDTMIERIVRTLSSAFPKDSKYFEKRGKKLENKLQEMLDTYKAKFSDIKDKNVIAIFPAFNYLLRAVGCKVVSTVLQSPGQMPSARKTASIIQMAREKNVALIVSAPIPDGGITENIARETGIRVVQLAPLIGFIPHTEDFTQLWETSLRVLYDGCSH